MALKTGDIVLLEFPYTNRAGSKYRPALVVHVENINRDLLVAYMSSEVDNYIFDENAVSIKATDLAEGTLKLDSVVRVDKLILVDQQRTRLVASLKKPKIDEVLRKMAALTVRDHYRAVHKPVSFIPGKSRIPFAGRVYDEKEMVSLVDSSLDFWLTSGRYAVEFEKKFADFLGIKHCSLTNSGSSANLLAFMALTSPKLGERRIKKGDEVITVAAAFPTTVAPIIQFGAVPVFADVKFPTYNIDCDQLEAALSEKTRAVMLAHTLGNPFDIQKVVDFCQKHALWLIEDCCDALGSTYSLQDQNISLQPSAFSPRLLGSFGHISTFSFYPAHHITMGEGGAVCTSNTDLKWLIESFRDWGRDCWCAPGRDNTCGRRFSEQFGELPKGYDHKYVYSHFGYNLKVTDMQASIGCAQLEKLPRFIEARKKNWKLLREGLSDLSDRFILPEPAQGSDPSWFGFLLTVRENAGFTRDDMVAHLEKAGIQTRMLFAGNLIKHPCFDEMRSSGRGFRIISTPDSPVPTPGLPTTDRIMRDTFWIGVYPGMPEAVIDYMLSCIKEFKGERHAS